MGTFTIKPGDFFRRGSTFCEILAVNDYDGGHGAGYRVAFLHGYNERVCVGGSTIWLAEEGSEGLIARDLDVVSKVSEGFSVTTVADAPWLTSSKYGTPEEVGQGYLHSERNYNRSAVRNFLVNGEVVDTVLTDHDLTMLVCNLHEPLKAEGAAISLIRTGSDRKRGRRTTMKPGKAFRLMFPTLSDKDVATITEAWIELNSPRDLTLHVAKSREAFAEAYGADRAPYRNPVTTFTRKSIATSCMQHVFRTIHEGSTCTTVSVGEAYASGDFAVAYLKDKDGLIAGRVVYSDVEGETRHAGPIYGACEQSLDMLQAHLDSLEVEYNVEAWAGLRFNLIGYDDDPVVPYVDGDIGGNPSRCGKYITLEKWGGLYCFDGTEGHVSPTVSCDECGAGLGEDEVTYTDWGPMCESCFDHSFVVLESGDVIDRDDAAEVRTLGWNGACTSIMVHIDEAVYCETIDQYWYIDDVTIDDDGNAMPTHLIPDDNEDDMEEAA